MHRIPFGPDGQAAGATQLARIRSVTAPTESGHWVEENRPREGGLQAGSGGLARLGVHLRVILVSKILNVAISLAALFYNVPRK